MTQNDADPQAVEEATVSVDAYGIKLKVRPGELDVPAPSSWSDVIAEVRRHLLRIAVAPTRLIAELFEGATRLVRGLSILPSALAQRVADAHQEADRREIQRQQGMLRQQNDQLAALPHPIERIEEILRKYREHGRDAYVVLGPDNTVIVVVGTPPESQELIGEAVEQFLLSSPDSTDSDSGE